MSFADDVGRFSKNVVVTNREVFVNTASHALESIQNGSVVTGAPGQPVDTGSLKASWNLSFPSPTEALISTNSPYAESNEDGIARPGGGPYVQRSPVGGRHSVQLTVLGLDKIVAVETERAAGGR